MRKLSLLSPRTSAPSQNPVYTIIVALSLTNILLIAAIIVFFTSKMTNDPSTIENTYFQSQLQQIKLGVTRLSKEDVATQPATNHSTKMYTNQGITFAYPANFAIATYSDELVENQQNIRITSQPGKLFMSSGGPGGPKSNEFEEGYQMQIRRINTWTDIANDVAQAVETTNPLVERVDQGCDGAGCPREQYLIKTKKGLYAADVQYSQGYSNPALVTQTIISSISE